MNRLEELGYHQLKDGEWRNEKLNGRIMYFNKDTDIVISIQNNEVVKFGGMDIISLTIDELNAVYHIINTKTRITSKEVCKILTNHYGSKVYYKKDKFRNGFHFKDSWYIVQFENGKLRFIQSEYFKANNLPPEALKAISEFYE